MKKTILFLGCFCLACGQLYARVFDIRIAGCDIWGTPVVEKDDFRRETLKNPVIRLFEEYSSPDFDEKCNKVFSSMDVEDLLVLCAIWANVATAEDKELLRNAVVLSMTGVDLKYANTVNAFLKSRWGSVPPPLDARLSAYLALMATDKIGLYTGDATGSGELTCMEMLHAVFLRSWYYACAADARADFRFFEELLFQLAVFANGKPLWLNQFLLFRQALSYEMNAFAYVREDEGDLRKRTEFVDEASPGYRLVLALATQEKNPQKAEAEIRALCDDFFAPAYPFMERICLRKKNFRDAAYFQYLRRRDPLNAYSFMEFMARKSNASSLFTSRAKDFLSELINAKLYDEAKAYGAYIKSKCLGYPITLEKELDSCIFRELIRNGITVSAEDVRKQKSLSVSDYVSPTFEKRFQDSLRERAEALKALRGNAETSPGN